MRSLLRNLEIKKSKRGFPTFKFSQRLRPCIGKSIRVGFIPLRRVNYDCV